MKHLKPCDLCGNIAKLYDLKRLSERAGIKPSASGYICENCWGMITTITNITIGKRINQIEEVLKIILKNQQRVTRLTSKQDDFQTMLTTDRKFQAKQIGCPKCGSGLNVGSVEAEIGGRIMQINYNVCRRYPAGCGFAEVWL